MRISSELKSFLNNNKVQKLINENNWGNIYDILEKEFLDDNIDNGLIGEFTKLLWHVDLNPLDYLDYIPAGFIADTDIIRFNIPNHIKEIKLYAFAFCNKLQNISIPSTVKKIGRSIFFFT